jgi:hypothetical protein
MEIKKTKVHLAYKIEEKPEGGFIARSDDPNVEPIEGATKVELFQKMRAKTAELVGKEIPLEAILKSSEFSVGGAKVNVNVNRTINMSMNTQRTLPQPDPRWMSNNARIVSEGTSRWNLWKLLFFILIALLIGWYFIRHY